MMAKLFCSSFSLLVAVFLLGPQSILAFSCGPSSQGFSFAGAKSLARLASAWVEKYSETCDQGSLITVEAGGSTTAGARVCGTSSEYDPVDVGGMIRDFNALEASSENDWYYGCERSQREVTQLEVASEGISAAVNIEGVASDCLYELGGLSIDQLRWIYSNLDETELELEGWDSYAVPNSDGNSSTHLWSELSSLCPEEEILIVVPDENSESYVFFSDVVFGGTDETFDVDRAAGFFNFTDEESMVNFVLENDAAIAFFGIGYIMTRLDQDEVTLSSVILSDGEIIKPSAVTFEDGSYPLSRTLYMNVYQEKVDLVKGFFEFAYSDEGDDALLEAGFWPADTWKKVLMATRLQSESGVPIDTITKACGPTGGSIAIAGSSTVYPVARLWSEIYKIGCDVEITVEGGGSSNGAGRVCGNTNRGTPVDIGDMSREWKTSEATQKNFLYSCLEPGDTTRSAIQIDVAIDGLTVAVREGSVAWDCIAILGGLSIDQLRWIYSNYNDKKLEETGWDPTCLGNSDYNSQTHLWSELDSRCESVEIRIAGADDQSGTYEYFLETVLTDHDNGETFDLARPGFGYENSEDDEVLVAYLQEFGQAISYFGYSYYYANQDVLSAVAIENDVGDFIHPNADTVGSGEYNPLARRIYMNLLNDAEALEDTAPFVKFGLQQTELVAVTGYVAIPDAEIEENIIRIDRAPYNTSDDSGLSVGGIVGIAVGGTVGLCCILVLCFFLLTEEDEDIKG